MNFCSSLMSPHGTYTISNTSPSTPPSRTFNRQLLNLEKRQLALAALASLPKQDFQFWTDASVSDHVGACATLLFEHVPTSTSQCHKRRRLLDNAPALRTLFTAPTGSIAAPTPSEKVAINMSIRHIVENPQLFSHSKVLIASDSRSVLSALELGPLRRHSATMEDYSETWHLLLAAAGICDTITLHYVPAHVGLPLNERADTEAKVALGMYTRQEQECVPITFTAFQTHLHRKLLENWTNSLVHLPSHRRRLLGTSRADIHSRASLPRAQQCLITRWRLGEVETVGRYPRRLGWTEIECCRLCGSPDESPCHLLSSCPGTFFYRLVHDLSTDDLLDSSSSAALKVVRFDGWLRTILPYAKIPPNFGIFDHLHDDQACRPSKRARSQAQNSIS